MSERVEAYCPECGDVRPVVCARCGAVVMPSVTHEEAMFYAQALYERLVEFRGLVRKVLAGKAPAQVLDAELERMED